ncbi:MAG: hypothetical protein AAGD11_07135 [Planctomycetota bacterium]
MDTQIDSVSTCKGSFVTIDGQDFYQILNHDQMRPFLMSIVSPNDHWMYVSSTGGLTAGRVRAENCLFPYDTVDQLHDCYRFTGPITLIRYRDDASNLAIWQPFADGNSATQSGPRRLLKHVAGDQIIFEEEHAELDLVFRYRWRTSAKFGFVRTSTLENKGTEPLEVEVLDGLQNVCPSGVALSTYQQASCLVDAYKHNEVDPSTGMGIYSLTAQILDRAEAAEVLRATTVWSLGLNQAVISLSSNLPAEFRRGATITGEALCTGQRGNFFASATVAVAANESKSWHLVADVARSHQRISQIRKRILEDASLESTLEESITNDHLELMRNVASADGLQETGSQLSSAHHFANVLFNNLRGGVSAENYWVESNDFIEFVASRNRLVATNEKSFLRGLPERINYVEFLALAAAQQNIDLIRLAYEYLPLTFGRRHGDPSRPWNAFEIKVHTEDGSKVYNYQGNWRDIFQNWEALCASFPAYLPSVVTKFLNASTIDGFNPYRITRDGIDWEAPDPDDPWSNIGYWGDHQIIYLSKLLKAMCDYSPGELQGFFDEQIFCYANVPYRIKPYADIVSNSSETIDYDLFTAKEIDRRVEDLGADGKLVVDAQGKIYYANIIEKLLVPVLSKLSNLVVDGGIWLNTQRPEWNDANNALVGSGLSMVTVCYLRRHLGMITDLLKTTGDKRFSMSVEVEQWFRSVRKVLQDHRSLLNQTSISDENRGRILSELGSAFSDYRLRVYEDGFSGKHTVAGSELVDFCRLAVEYFDHSIRANRRADGLYHAYNLVEIDEATGAARVDHLYEMLEGQVAVLSSGALDLAQAAELIQAMFESKLYREDQRSFMLYPNRQLRGFLARNRIPESKVNSVSLLRQLVDAGDRSLVVRDAFGEFHFHHAIERVADLEAALGALEQDARWTELVDKHRQQVFDVFESVFNHKTYTGRSGTMYGYEGLGCIYWHMVSKLLLAVQENVFAALDQQSRALAEALADSYYLVRGGLSSDKTPVEYGAFPTDPYSHTTMHSGAQQPGMTGQVKEEVLTRQGELGVQIRNGEIQFQPFLLRRREFLQAPSTYQYFDLDGKQQKLPLEAGSLAFSVCQVPVVYRLTDTPFLLRVQMADGTLSEFESDILDGEISSKLFQRTGEVERIEVDIPDGQIVFA